MNLSNVLARKRRILQLVSVSLVATAMFGCAKKEEKDTYSYLWDNKFNSCGLVCHNSSSSDGTENGPDLSSKDKFYANLLNRNVATNYGTWVGVRTGNCNSAKFIRASDGNKSTLASSMVQSVSVALAASENCFTTYGFHRDHDVAITDPELAQALIDWINKGAQNN